MEQYTVYITINLLNNKAYVGMTNKTNISNKKFKNYFGRDKDLLEDIKKYGKENFIKTSLGIFYNWKECHYWEGFYIRTLHTHISEGGYNIRWDGGGYTPVPWNKNKNHTPETIEKMKHPHKLSKNFQPKFPHFSGENHPMFGKKHKKESIELMKINRSGKPAWNKGVPMKKETKEKLKKPKSKEHKQKLKEAWKIRRLTPVSEKTKEKCRIKKECPYCHRFFDKRNFKRWHGDNCKKK